MRFALLALLSVLLLTTQANADTRGDLSLQQHAKQVYATADDTSIDAQLSALTAYDNQVDNAEINPNLLDEQLTESASNKDIDHAIVKLTNFINAGLSASVPTEQKNKPHVQPQKKKSPSFLQTSISMFRESIRARARAAARAHTQTDLEAQGSGAEESTKEEDDPFCRKMHNFLMRECTLKKPASPGAKKHCDVVQNTWFQRCLPMGGNDGSEDAEPEQ